MNKQINKMVLLLILALTTFGLGAQDYDGILDKTDEITNFTGTDFSAVMNLISVDPVEGNDLRKVNIFRRDEDDKFLLLILAPEEEKGQGYLKSGDNLWMYDPISRKFSHFSLKENFEGTDAKNSDFNRSTLGEDYRVTSGTEGKLGKYEVYILELEGLNDEVSYPYQKIWVRKDNNLVLKTESYSLTKRLLRTSLYPAYAKIGEKYIATKVIIRDELVKGKKTQMTFTDVSVDAVPASLFSKSYLERVNK